MADHQDRIAEFKEVAELMPDDPVVRFGLGSHVWDVDGHEYIDYPLALGPIILAAGAGAPAWSGLTVPSAASVPNS